MTYFVSDLAGQTLCGVGSTSPNMSVTQLAGSKAEVDESGRGDPVGDRSFSKPDPSEEAILVGWCDQCRPGDRLLIPTL
ncbi:MAG: hypothetical protein ACK5RL_11000 [Acidimicrobiales bacterium]